MHLCAPLQSITPALTLQLWNACGKQEDDEGIRCNRAWTWAVAAHSRLSRWSRLVWTLSERHCKASWQSNGVWGDPPTLSSAWKPLDFSHLPLLQQHPASGAGLDVLPLHPSGLGEICRNRIALEWLLSHLLSFMPITGLIRFAALLCYASYRKVSSDYVEIAT